MKLQLLSLPDCETLKFTVDKVYEIRSSLGNGYVVMTDDMKHLALVLQERFSPDEPR